MQWDVYSALKREEILTHNTTRVNSEDIMLNENEISSSQKNTYYILPLM